MPIDRDARKAFAPDGCKMNIWSRYASDEDCKLCGLGEGDVCEAYRSARDQRIADKKAAHVATVPPASALASLQSQVDALTRDYNALRQWWDLNPSLIEHRLEAAEAEVNRLRSEMDREIADLKDWSKFQFGGVIAFQDGVSKMKAAILERLISARAALTKGGTK